MNLSGDDWQRIVLIAVAVAAMAFAGVAQTLIGVTSRQRLRGLVSGPEAPSGHRSVQSIADPRRALFATMLLVQVLAAIVASVQMESLLNDHRERDDYSWLASLIVVLLYLVFGQALPRALAAKDLERFLNGVIRIAQVLTTILRPVTWLVDRVALLFARILPGRLDEGEVEALEEELQPRSYEADDEVIGADEREMIDGILSLEEMTVRDIMVPRLDIVAVDRMVAPRELIDIITKAGHSRVPVYQGSIDRILGVLYVKDLLPLVIGSTRSIPLLDLIRPAFVVPESKKLDTLFAELKRAKIHIAIVADEYGGTAGLVTIEDILEEIVGEIQDEYDTEQPLFEQVEPDVLLADGRLPIEDVEDALGVTFEEDENFATLGGFVHKHLGRLPIQGDIFEAEGVRVEILAVERHRVRRLRITRLPEPVIEEPHSGRRFGRGEDRSHEEATATDEPSDDA